MGRVLGRGGRGPDFSLRTGRFGPYVQKGEATEEAPKPPRASLPKGWAPDTLTLERAMELLSLPRIVGMHPEDGVVVEAAIGRFGPYVKHGSVYANLPDVEEVFTIGMNRAVEVLAQKAAGRRGGGGGGRAAAGLGRASRWRAGRGHAGQIRALCEMGQGERDAAQGDWRPRR